MPRRRSILMLPLSLALPVGAETTSTIEAPVLAGFTSRGEAISLEALRGSVVLVFAWSARCPVCLDKPFVIVALNLDPSAEQMLNYERALELTGAARSQLKNLWRGAPRHRDNFGELPQKMPTALIFDKDGALRKSVRGRVPAELWDDIAELVLG
jgi:hypothetical protein